MKTAMDSIIPLEYDLFVGIDVDKRSLSITLYDHEKKIRSLTIANSGQKLINYIKKQFSDRKVAFAFEVGPTGYGLYDQLTESGYTCLVVNPSSVPTPPGSRVKTNRIDSQRIGLALRGGELKSVRVPSKKYRYLRHLIHLYNITIKQSTKYKCRIKAIFTLEGMDYPNKSKNDHWTNKTIKRLEELDCPTPIRFKLDILLENLRFTRKQLLRIKKEMRQYCNNDQDLSDSLRYLMSIPGIGWTIGVHLLARIGDWRNLRNVRELAGFIGLAPCEHSTGDTVRKGNITRAGDSRLRNMLIEGSWSAVAYDSEMQEFYHRIYARHPRDRAARKAIVAVTRKITTRIFRVLKDRRPYIPIEEYRLKNRSSNKKRRLTAPKDASTLRRIRKYGLKRELKSSQVLVGSFTR